MSDLRVPLEHPEPDCRRFNAAILTQYAPSRPALVEYGIDPPIARRVCTELLGRAWVEPIDAASRLSFWENMAQVWYRLGYDCIRIELAAHFSNTLYPASARPDGQHDLDGCTMNMETGPITCWDDLREYPWPGAARADLSCLEHLASVLPEGMGITVGFEGGVFHNLVRLMGLEGLSLRLYDQPGLVEAVAEQLGEVVVGYYQQALQIERVTALFPGDDLAFGNGTFLGPEHLRRHVLPWHSRCAALAHEAGRPYLLHCPGDVSGIMADLVDKVGIDACHGFEDRICSASQFKRQWGHRVGVLGGVDCSALTALKPTELRRYVRGVIDECGPGGGFALGCGSTVPADVPLENYLTMLDEAMRT